MTHYEKLATMTFRVIGIFFLVPAALSFALVLVFFALGFQGRGGPDAAIQLFVLYTLPATIVGLIFFKLSKKLSKKVCSNFDE